MASKHGHGDILKMLLYGDGGNKFPVRKFINPNYFNGYCITVAVRNGHVDVVKILLNDRRVKLNIVTGALIKFACKNIEMLKLLLKDGRCHPDLPWLRTHRVSRDSQWEYQPKFGVAQTRGPDGKLIYQTSIKYACTNGNIEMVKLLIRDVRVRSHYTDTFSIYMANKNGHIDIVKLLLKNKKIYNMWYMDYLKTNVRLLRVNRSIKIYDCIVYVNK